MSQKFNKIVKPVPDLVFRSDKFRFDQHASVSVQSTFRRTPETVVQRAALNGSTAHSVPSIVHDILHSHGHPLDAGTRTFMESRFGHDFSGVRVHSDERAAESARSVNALAYTVGRDVVFGAGQYDTGTAAGKRLLAHELTHVVQQSRAAPLSIQRAGSDEKAESKGADTTKTAEKSDAAIDALDLAPDAKKAAKMLKEEHPDITFTSGRRNIAEQAHAMASNIVSSDRKWIEKTYTSAAKLQKWVDDNPKSETVEEIAKGLEKTMKDMTDSERANVSKHLTGEAFDVQPQEKDAEKIKKDIKNLPGVTKFLEKEGNLVRWHAQFKKELHIAQTGDWYEQEAEQMEKHVLHSALSEQGNAYQGIKS